MIFCIMNASLIDVLNFKLFYVHVWYNYAQLDELAKAVFFK